MTVMELVNHLSSFTNVCYSGGAKGADRFFGIWASENGFLELHLSFAKHNHSVNEENILSISDDLLVDKQIFNMLKTISRKLGRHVPRKLTYTYNLLARNMYQILSTDSVYCLAEIDSPTTVAGGTAWAVEAYKLISDNPKIYVYNILDDNVYSYINGYFVKVQTVPTPSGRWTGIGSRDAKQHHMVEFSKRFV